MIKTVHIDGREVTFKSTAATALRYKQQFNSDFFADMVRLSPIAQFAGQKEVPAEVLQQLDFEVFYNILWTMARTADPTLPDPIAWLDTFEEFPVFDILPEVQDLLAKTLSMSKKK